MELTIAPFTPNGKVGVVKLPLIVPPDVITSKLCPLGTKLLIVEVVRWPVAATLPETANWSYWVPTVTPPSSASIVPVELSKWPVMLRAPKLPGPPGRIVPVLINVLPAPTLTVPFP